MAGFDVKMATTVDDGGIIALAARLSEAQVEAIVRKYAHLIADRAEELAPERTGALIDSITVKLSGAAATITAGEGLPDKRAVYQEFGFVHYRSGKFIINPFMRPALAEYADAFVAEIAALFA